MHKKSWSLSNGILLNVCAFSCIWSATPSFTRSQAKRVVTNFDQFIGVTFDFKNVTVVGHGFVDQLFRVLQNQYPAIKLTYICANNDVKFMVLRRVGT